VAASRTILVAGAGIGGLTAAIALATSGFRVIVIERAAKFEEVGAGLQLSPNASRILSGLGVDPFLNEAAVTPEAISVMSGRAGREVVRIPIGAEATFRYGAPYLILHRADLQKALLQRVGQLPDIDLRLGVQFEDAATHANGVTVAARHGDNRRHNETAIGLIGADGLWSAVRNRFFGNVAPQFSGKIAWRGSLDPTLLPREFNRGRVQLWLGPNAHLVAYPIRGGRLINLVAIADGKWNRPGWNEPADAAEVTQFFATGRWPGTARMMINAVEQWSRWALFNLPELPSWSHDRVGLLGDAAHAMLPFAAQGAGMAIEDAAVLAKCLDDPAISPAQALQRYGAMRRSRVARVQRTAIKLGRIYQMRGAAAVARDLAMKAMGGKRLLAEQDWIYDWKGA
jgi:salicylate hydroxylase